MLCIVATQCVYTEYIYTKCVYTKYMYNNDFNKVNNSDKIKILIITLKNKEKAS